MDFVHELRQIYGFIDANPIRDGVGLADQLREVLVPDDLVLLVPAHDGVVGSEAVKALAEDAVVEELVLAEKVQRAVGYGRSGENQVIAANLAEVVECLAALSLRIFDLAAFVADNHVRLPLCELGFQPPAGFVVDHDNLQTSADHIADCVGFSCAAAIEDGKTVRKTCEFLEFFVPDVHNGLGRDDQQLQHFALIEHGSGDCYSCDCLAGTHIHEKCTAFTCLHGLHRPCVSLWPAPYATADAVCQA